MYWKSFETIFQVPAPNIDAFLVFCQRGKSGWVYTEHGVNSFEKFFKKNRYEPAIYAGCTSKLNFQRAIPESLEDFHGTELYTRARLTGVDNLHTSLLKRKRRKEGTWLLALQNFSFTP